MADLEPLTHGYVRGRFLAGILDSADVGDTPDVEALTGYVEFSLSADAVKVTTADPDPATVFATKLRVNLDTDGRLAHNGSNLIALLATDDPSTNPTDLQWRVAFFLRQGANQLSYPSFSFTLPAGTTVDLTTVAPLLTPAPNTIIIKGDKGDPGDGGGGPGGPIAIADVTGLPEALAEKVDAEESALVIEGLETAISQRATQASVNALSDGLATTNSNLSGTHQLALDAGTAAGTALGAANAAGTAASGASQAAATAQSAAEAAQSTANGRATTGSVTTVAQAAAAAQAKADAAIPSTELITGLGQRGVGRFAVISKGGVAPVGMNAWEPVFERSV